LAFFLDYRYRKVTAKRNSLTNQLMLLISLDLSMCVLMFQWRRITLVLTRDVHDLTTTFHGRCTLAIDTPTPTVVHDLVELY
jgi:hypothetical protein